VRFAPVRAGSALLGIWKGEGRERCIVGRGLLRAGSGGVLAGRGCGWCRGGGLLGRRKCCGRGVVSRILYVLHNLVGELRKLKGGRRAKDGRIAKGDLRFRIQFLSTMVVACLETLIAFLLELQRFRRVSRCILSCHLFLSLLCSL